MWVALMQRAGFEVFDTREIKLELTQNGEKVPELFYAFMAKKCRSIVSVN
jgi:hypothetical protein